MISCSETSHRDETESCLDVTRFAGMKETLDAQRNRSRDCASIRITAVSGQHGILQSSASPNTREQTNSGTVSAMSLWVILRLTYTSPH